MCEQPPIPEDELIGGQQSDISPELPELHPCTQPKNLWLKRAVAGLALSSMIAGVASQPSLREAAARSVAGIIEETPLGWADQALDAYVAHEAGWDSPVETTIKVYRDPEHPAPRDARVTNFVIPGFREMHGKLITQHLVDATEHDYPTRYVAYGNQPVTPDSLAQLIIKNIENDPLHTPEIGFTGHSMGGVLALEALARVHEMGYKLPKVAFIDFLSTPAGMPTARFSGLADFFAKTDIGQKATGALITDVLQQMEAQHFQPSWYLHDIAKAWHDVPHGASAALTASQLEDLDKIDSQQALTNLLRRLHGVLSPDTKVTYFAPVDPSSDTVVDDPESYKRLAQPFKLLFGITVRYVTWGNGHADSDFASNSRAEQQLALSMTPKLAPTPGSPTAIPGITSPAPGTSSSETPQSPAMAVADPVPAAVPSPSASPSP